MNADELLGDVKRNLLYWQSQLQGLDDERIRQLSPRHESLRWAVDLGIRFGETRVETAVLLLAAFLWIERERREQAWLPLIKRLLKTTEIQQAPKLHTQLNIHYGILLRLNAQLQQAQQIHQQTLANLPAQTPLAQIANLHYQLSETYRRQHNLPAAIHHAEKAKIILEAPQQDNALLAKVVNTLGLLHLDSGQLWAANQFFQKALSLEHQINQPTRLARVLNNLALTAKRQQKHEQALIYYSQSLECLEGTSNIADRVTIYINQGSLYFAQQNWSAAEAAFHYAQSLLDQQPGLFYFEAMVSMNLGKVAEARRQYKHALIQLKKSRQLWQQVDDPIYLANVYGTMAEIHAAQGDAQTAHGTFQTAIELLTPHREHAWGRLRLQEFKAAQQKLPNNFERQNAS
ncbi:MAG: tetratricopeptide repeat protein [Chloroflexota bacterium]